MNVYVMMGILMMKKKYVKHVIILEIPAKGLVKQIAKLVQKTQIEYHNLVMDNAPVNLICLTMAFKNVNFAIIHVNTKFDLNKK